MPEERNTEKILFVINPISGDIDKNSLKTDIRKFMSEHKRVPEFYTTSGENDKEKISELIKEHKPWLVVAAGGDGTCNLVAQCILQQNIKMAVLPMGSANGIATEIDLPVDLEENLKLIIKANSKPIDVLRINNDYISLHLSDIGFNAQLINNYDEGEMRGLIGYAKSFFDELGNATPAKFEIICDNKTTEIEAFMVVIANASKFGTGAIINPEGKPDDGIFEIVVVRPQNFMNFLEMLVPFYTRRIHTLDFVDTYKCKQVKINNLQKQNLQIDGENMGQPRQVNVEILPRSIDLIVP